MFNSVKSKIILITLGIFVIFNLIVLSLRIGSYYRYKNLKIENYSVRVAEFKEYIDSNINQLETNVRSLSMMAAGYYFYHLNKKYLDFAVVANFRNNNRIATGGGIFYEPYLINNKKRYSTYASWVNDDIVIDNKSNSNEYDYHKRNWYLDSKNNYTKEKRNVVIWSAPYYDALGEKKLMVTATSAIYDKDLNYIGLASVDWLLETIIERIENIAPINGSIVIFADKKHDFIIAVNDNKGIKSKFIGKSLKSLSWYNDKLKNGQTLKIGPKGYRAFIANFDNGMTLIVNIPNYEIYGKQRNNVLYGVLAQLCSAILLFIGIFNIIKRNVNNPINKLIEATKEIGKGNFDTKIDIKSPKEFRQLATTFNKMTTDMKKYLENIKNLTNEKDKIEKDLNIAKEIQISALPNYFPPFPDIVSIDIFASMNPAKKVGGDFYDFYFIDYRHIVFTIADVSGKGVPAALFMMRAKSVLKSSALTNPLIETVMMKINNSICDNNDKDFFVTVGFGVIDILSGEIIYINAGHNAPILKTTSEIKYLDVPKNIVLGAFEDMPFEVIKFKMNPLDTIFLYTDGVTEATNKNLEMYGEDRLLEIVKKQNTDTKTIIKEVKKDIDAFVNEYEQADDITMLALTYLGTENMIQKTHVPAEISNLDSFIEWLEKLLSQTPATKDEISKVLISAEEVFVNIAYYAYPDKLKEKIQETTIVFKHIKPLNEINLIFTDSGVQYNPLEKQDPDINQNAEERKVGGLGIYMVKNMMTSVKYEYKNKQNILKLKLILKGENK